jgi:ABC-type lipopolysaccharide export system ATPase subunit
MSERPGTQTVISASDQRKSVPAVMVGSEGTKDFLINNPISRQLYLGERFQM